MGAEASPFLDKQSQVVYKLFDVRAAGDLGKRIVLEKDSEGNYEIITQNATLQDILDKRLVLHEAGAHPTEIVLSLPF